MIEENRKYILPTTYLGNVLYYALLANKSCIIEQHANYIKQTYANRCTILSANGALNLTIPVEKTKEKTPICDIRIANKDNWQQLHWRAIESAYNSSPFFLFFRDEMEIFYSKKWDFLVDFNLEIQDFIINSLNLRGVDCSISDNYTKCDEISKIDCKDLINPKKFCVSLREICDTDLSKSINAPYYQLFDQKFGFTPNLSIIDLLFNMGNEAKIYLKNIGYTLGNF